MTGETVEVIDITAINSALQACLTRCGWTPENLGNHLNTMARSLALPDRMHPKTARRWVRAVHPHTRPCVPRQPWPGLVCAVLSRKLGKPVTLGSLGWTIGSGLLYVPADDGLDHAWDPPGALASLMDVLEADGMDRRYFLAITGVSLTALAHQWLLDPARVAASVQGKRVDLQLVADVERVVEARRGMDDAIGGGGLLRALREDLRIVTEVLSNSSYTEALGARLHVAAAELSRLAGYQSVKAGKHAAAQRYYAAALRSAHASGDRAVGANVLAFMSFHSISSGDPRDAVVMTDSALQGGGQLTPKVASYLHSRRARAAACCGDLTTWDRSRGLSFDLLNQSRQEDEPVWLYWLDEAFLQGDAGAGALELDRAKDAERYNRLAVATIKPELQMDRMEYLAQLARARTGIGEVEHACQAAVEAATAVRRQDSAYTRQQLIRFRTDVTPHASHVAVQEFDAKFKDLLSV
ncbi:MAG: hypothetical protein ACRDSP_09960 [Pseudonocardiaceae bacterium]